jgi:predicted nucleic acid-binding protein
VILLDASVWLAAFDRDDRFHAAALTLVRSTAVAHGALDLTLYEVANVAVRSWRDQEQGNRVSDAVIVACADRLVRVDDALLQDAIGIADEHGITVYDAAYVAAARRERCPLVSGDVADLVARDLAIAPDAVCLP